MCKICAKEEKDYMVSMHITGELSLKEVIAKYNLHRQGLAADLLRKRQDRHLNAQSFKKKTVEASTPSVQS